MTNLAGTAVNTTIGGTNKTYAELAGGPGFIHPTNNAKIVQKH